MARNTAQVALNIHQQYRHAGILWGIRPWSSAMFSFSRSVAPGNKPWQFMVLKGGTPGLQELLSIQVPLPQPEQDSPLKYILLFIASIEFSFAAIVCV